MSSVLEKVTKSNWNKLASKVAEEVFPKGTLVNWHYANGIYFGLVSSISRSGKITIQKGELPLEKVTDNKDTGGTYGKFWYKADLDGFVPYTKEDLRGRRETPRTRFNPNSYYGKDWKKIGCDCPIAWHQVIGNRLLTLSKPKITENYLILNESYCD